jgi:uncharacterized FAD-dependent dehydrogenase
MVATQKAYDVIIVGAGPAGIFAALELAKHPELKTLILEKGPSLDKRRCPSRISMVNCVRCRTCAQLNGWGGAGAFSDGKLTLSTEVGGRLGEYLTQERLRELTSEVDQIYLDHGATPVLHGKGDVQALVNEASMAGLRLIPTPIRHLGTDECDKILSHIYDSLRPKIDIRFNSSVTDIEKHNGQLWDVSTAKGQSFTAPNVVLAPGRDGHEWLTKVTKRLGLTFKNNPVDIGVRVEADAAVLEKYTRELYEAKIEHFTPTFDDRVRTFCMCPNGEVTMEMCDGEDPVITVNGHSNRLSKTGNTNFALLVSTNFTEPFHEPIAYGKYVARLANMISGGVLVQRLGDLLAGRRSTPSRMTKSTVRPTLKSAVPGDLSYVLPHRHLIDILETLEALEKIIPGVNSRNTLLYGIEVKFYSARLELDKSLQTRLPGLYAIGDGAGITRGLVQASASGLVASRAILAKASPRAGGALAL